MKNTRQQLHLFMDSLGISADQRLHLAGLFDQLYQEEKQSSTLLSTTGALALTEGRYPEPVTHESTNTAAIAELQQASKELEQYARVLSHDLRSPLRTISSYVELLQKRHKQELADEGKTFLQYIAEKTDQMNTVIQDLLAYIRTGQRVQQHLLTDLNKVLELVEYQLRTELTATGGEIRVGELPQIMAARTSMQQIFQQLILNALQFRSTAPPVVEIRCIREAGHWHFLVSDNGMGLDEAHEHKAFEPFQRIHMGSPSGTGVGLAICKKWVELHQGEIWYQARPQGGTTFHFTIVAHQ